MKASIKIIAMSAVAAALFSGCVTTELETSATMTQTIFLEPVAAEKRIVFLNIKNTSGKNINLGPRIAQILSERGYKITDDPARATYILSTNILYCDKKSENNAANAAALGGTTAGLVGAYNHTGAGAIAAHGLIGAGVGALVGKMTEDTIYQMQVDINIKERRAGGVMASKGSVQGQASVDDQRRAGLLNSFGGAVRGNRVGQLNSNLVNNSQQSYKSDFIEHNTMMFAEAVKMRLKLEEAIPVLEEKMAQQISGLF